MIIIVSGGSMRDIDKFFKCSILDELCDARRDEFSHKIIKYSKEYQNLKDDTERKIKELLDYVPGELYKELEQKIDDALFNNIMEMTEFWNVNFYKLGFMDGLNVKKELQEQMEEYNNG
jgi:hypothetical protein